MMLARGLLGLVFCASVLAAEEPAAANAPAPDDANLRPDEVLVLANKASKDSVAVAKYYLSKRGIPETNYLELDFPGYQHPNAISFEDFQSKAVAPLKKHLEEKQLKDKVLCFVSAYDVPYVVAGAKISKEEQEALAKRIPESQRGQAGMILTTKSAFDSELAWLYRNEIDALPLDDLKRRQAYCYLTPNVYAGQQMKFRQFRKEAAQHPRLKNLGTQYMTARLDGPTPEIAKRLVDLALQAEKDGPDGKGYFDSKGPTFGKRKLGYSMGEFWARRAWIETHNAGFATVKEETGKLFGPGECPETLMYWGWYALTNYQQSFTPAFKPGAVAVHTASFEATNLRAVSEKGGQWVPGFLTQGVTACAGSVAEPFLAAFPHAELFFPRLYQGWTLSEAYWNAQTQVSWMMVLIGDPLYTPFGGAHARKTYVQGLIQFSNPGMAAPVIQPMKNEKVGLVIQLRAPSALFQHPDQYKLIDPGTNRATAKLLDLDMAKFEARDGGKLLVISGASLQTGDLPDPNPQSEDGEELELHIDLGSDGGRKIVSQQFFALPGAKKP
ncbi:MAG: TIGR03790 family protein [Planctomycetota bacterium]|nr:TIGR03790 family protein [Planctomycetota bacterium]